MNNQDRRAQPRVGVVGRGAMGLEVARSLANQPPRPDQSRTAHVLAGDSTPLSAVEILVKDLDLVLDAARPEKWPLPLAATAHRMSLQASASGPGTEDDSAVIKTFPGIALPKPAVA